MQPLLSQRVSSEMGRHDLSRLSVSAMSSLRGILFSVYCSVYRSIDNFAYFRLSYCQAPEISQDNKCFECGSQVRIVWIVVCAVVLFSFSLKNTVFNIVTWRGIYVVGIVVDMPYLWTRWMRSLRCRTRFSPLHVDATLLLDATGQQQSLGLCR